MAARGLVILAGSMLLGVAGVQLFYAFQEHSSERGVRTVYTLAPVDPACKVSQGVCTAADQDVRVALQFDGAVKGLTPFRVQAVVDGAEVQDVTLAFTMVGMDMGQNRYRLLPGGNGWTGVVTLPLCVTGRTDWVAELAVADGRAEWRAAFPFSATAN